MSDLVLAELRQCGTNALEDAERHERRAKDLESGARAAREESQRCRTLAEQCHAAIEKLTAAPVTQDA